MISILVAGFFTISLIIIVHELGHYLAARAVGIHVHRFSLGMGPILLRWNAFSTEWAISLLPFGGYVKMAGMEAAPMEGEAVVEESTIPPEALFRNKGLPQRFFAIIAGPLANLILAILLSVGLLWHGGEPIYPGSFIDTPPPGTAAAVAGAERGDSVLSLDGEAVVNWNGLDELLRSASGSEHTMLIDRNGTELALSLVWNFEGEDQPELGLRPLLDNRVGKVLRGGPAAKLGLERGDRIVEIAGNSIEYYDDIAVVVNANPGNALDIIWERTGNRMEGQVTPEAADVPDAENGDQLKTVGRIFFEPYIEQRPVSFGEALAGGTGQVIYTAQLTIGWLAKMVTFRGDRESVGGPILIFKTAGEMMRWGFGRLLIFIAFFSTQLCLLNLLPIPVLDGGHLVFLSLEALKIPVNENWRLRLTMVGMFFLLGLMALIVLKDIGTVFFR